MNAQLKNFSQSSKYNSFSLSQDDDNLKSTDEPTTSKIVDGTPHFTADSSVIDLTQDTESIDEVRSPSFNSGELSTSISAEDRVEELLANFYLKNMYPSNDDMKFMSGLADKSEEYVKMWFREKQKSNILNCNLSKNQVPLAKVFFKRNPKPKLEVFENLSHILKAEKLAVFRYFKLRRKKLKIKSWFNYTFKYSEDEKTKLKQCFNKYKGLSVEKLIEIARETNIDQIKVENWYVNNMKYFYSRKPEGRNSPEPVNNYQSCSSTVPKSSVQNLLKAGDEPSTPSVNNVPNQPFVVPAPNYALIESNNFHTNPALSIFADFIYDYPNFMRYFSILSQLQPTASIGSLMSQTNSHFYDRHLRNMQNVQQFFESARNDQTGNNQAISSRNVQQDHS